MTLTEISKTISFALRHRPERLGLTLDKHGWADVPALIEAINAMQPFDMATLEKIVAEDEKQRYSFNEDKTRIRANQGHSIPVDVEMPRRTPPEFLWHGTGEQYVKSIEKGGLIPKSRLYVHLSADEETALKVGRRHGKPVLFRVASGRMAKDGFVFYLSQNGVWQTEKVPRRYLERLSGR